MLPPDGHVHSEWSWDAARGSMERTCARAVEIGLPSIAFTEHADFTPWTLLSGGLPAGVRAEVTPDGVLVPPVFDAEGYLACIQRCRWRFPGLRILSGVELGEPHWHTRRAADLLDLGSFDRVLGSVHSLQAGEARFLETADAYQERPAADVVRGYLAEATRMTKASGVFAVLAHVDYAVRQWPSSAGPYDPGAFEEDYRDLLGALAGTSRALEVNTNGPLHPQVVRWWHEAGGDAVAFGSDAHDPDTLARDFHRAAAMVEAYGFRPGRSPHDLWRRA
ncbi:MAG TPA: PHP domain-containing protein [Micromonosporaceae bacterium]|nr:PHP domain-containing protein [Micromonosporaceae bacterium]